MDISTVDPYRKALAACRLLLLAIQRYMSTASPTNPATVEYYAVIAALGIAETATDQMPGMRDDAADFFAKAVSVFTGFKATHNIPGPAGRYQDVARMVGL